MLSERITSRKQREASLKEQLDKENIYLQEFLKASPHIAYHRGRTGIMHDYETYAYWEHIDRGLPLQSYYRSRPDDHITRTIEQSRFREQATQKYAWAVPTTEVILKIARYSPILSVGAGSGYWEMLLAMAGAKVMAYDAHWEAKQQFKFEHMYYPVLHATDREAVKAYPEHNLFLCWPSYSDKFALRAMRRSRCKYLIYIGEWMAATACERFHDELEERFQRLGVLDIPSYQYIRDHVYIYKRRKVVLR